MEKAKWIWYYGDFEIFHSAKLHSLREEHGTIFPGFWSLANVYPIVRFTPRLTTTIIIAYITRARRTIRCLAYDKTNANLALIAPDTGEIAVGGHANVFETIDGQLYLSLHLHQNDSDGSGTGGWRCPSIIALREEGQHGSVKLVLGLDSDKYAIKTAGTTWQVAKNFSSAGISFTARLDNNVVTGVK